MSLRAHLFNWVLRRKLSKGAGGDFDVERMRRMLEGAKFPLPKGTRSEAATVGGVCGEWVRPTSGRPSRRLLYIHGGGFMACSARTHRPITGAFAQRGFEVFAPNYRLAPEHPFPAGLDDCVAAYRALAGDGRLAVAGESAGANLALGVIFRARAAALLLPDAAALFSPAVDLLGTGESHVTNAHRDPMLNEAALRKLVPMYLAGADAADPLLSPLYGDFTGVPPLLVHAGEREILRDDAVRLADKARRAGVVVSLKIYPVVPHAWQIATNFLPEARHSVDLAAAFLRAYMDTPAGVPADRSPVPAVPL